MKNIILHIIILCAILVGGLFIYQKLFSALSELKSNPEAKTKVQQFIQRQPERATKCGANHLLASIESVDSAVESFKSALRKFFLGGTLGLFLLFFARELYIFRLYSTNT